MSRTPSVVWNETALAAIRRTRPELPVAARLLFLLHAAMFDAWAAYDRSALGVSWQTLARRPAAEHSEAHGRVAMAYAAYRVLSDLFPGETARLDPLLGSLGLSPDDTGRDPATPAGVGNLAAAELLASRRADGANQQGGYADTSGYRPVNSADQVSDGGRWQPLRVSDGHGGQRLQSFVTPHWGRVRGFALARPDQFRPGPPVRWGTPEFLEQVREVLAYSAGLTSQQKAVAEYWARGPGGELPPGHWTLLGAFVSSRDGHDPGQDVRMFLALSGSLLDASVACWEAKRHYDAVRPASAVRFLLRGKAVRGWAGPGQDDTEMPASRWRPYLPTTPPSPGYPSAHSMLGSAAAETLRLFTGSDVFGAGVTLPARESRREPGEPAKPVRLSWATFSDAAAEAGLSRRYGGVAFRDADLAGRAAGRLIGQQAHARALHHFDPRLHPAS